MKSPEPMKNLWMESAAPAGPVSVHTGNSRPTDFIPSWKHGQRIDPERHSEVIPLRGVSY
jgi:hypothetical protein